MAKADCGSMAFSHKSEPECPANESSECAEPRRVQLVVKACDCLLGTDRDEGRCVTSESVIPVAWESQP